MLALFLRGASLPGRGEIVEKRLPVVPRPERLLRPAAIASIVGAVCLIVFPYDFRQALINSLLGIVICLSLVVIIGFVGQISVVQLALAGVAGFTMSHLTTDVGGIWATVPDLAADRSVGRHDRRPRRSPSPPCASAASASPSSRSRPRSRSSSSAS